MPDVMIVNVPPYVGEYEFDLDAAPFSTVEWRWIKQLSGYLPLTIEEGWKGADPSLFLAFAVISMRRAGRIVKNDVLATAEEIEEAPFDGVAITFRADSESKDDDVDPQSGSASNASPPSAGESSSEPTEPSQESDRPKVIGIRDSDTGSESAQATSGT